MNKLNSIKVRPNRYMPINYYKIQCFVTDDLLKDLLKKEFNPLEEGDTSVVVAVSTRRKDDIFHLSIRYGILLKVIGSYPKLEEPESNLPKIEDTIDLGIQIENLNKN